MSVPAVPVPPWLEPWFQVPTRVELASGHHLRPLRAADEGLPGLPVGLDLGAAVAAATARSSFCFGVFDDEERSVLGWVTLDPGAAPYDVEVGWAVAPEQVGTHLAETLGAALPGWATSAWPWTSPRVTRR
ncbi:hypothetical protein [Nocardioides litoris]|uniref:hypothetical protein n=1 Tax=Nocardioides litoris TaxID=1926648 RepID=UPI00111D57A7|nr:hypothetical protein [Nocardioides litoris]